jgi:hypothetical protein
LPATTVPTSDFKAPMIAHDPPLADRWLNSGSWTPAEDLLQAHDRRQGEAPDALWGFACYQFAALGVVEATVESDDEKNRLCPPIPYWDVNEDYLAAFLATMMHEPSRSANLAVARWARTTRLNPTGGIEKHRDDPRVIEASELIKRFAMPAVMNLKKLLGRQY